MKSNKACTKSLLIITFVFVVMFVLNYWMPLHRDDYDYSMIWGTAKHIDSLQDIFISLYNHYMNHGGRMVTVFILKTFLWIGKIWFDLANAAAFTLFVVLLYFHGCRTLELYFSPKLLGITALLAWLSFPHFGEVAIWKSGSTVYLWSGLIIALFLLPYNLFFVRKISGNRVFTLGMFVLGFFSGWSLENLSVTAFIIVAGTAFYCKRYLHNMPLWMPVGALGCIVGLIALIGAPGNFVRYKCQGSGKGVLIHIGNQLAGNGEMLLYILPMMLLLLLAYRILKENLVQVQIMKTVLEKGSYKKRIFVVAILLAFIYSCFNGAFIANTIRDFLTKLIVIRLPINPEKIPGRVLQFANVMAGFEEITIYWCCIFLFYSIIKIELGFTKESIKVLNKQVDAKMIWDNYKEIHFPVLMFFFAFISNLVMIGAPTFPARATFGAVAMIIVGSIGILHMPLIYKKLLEARTGRSLLGAGVALGCFTIVSALHVMYAINGHNAKRIAEAFNAAKVQKEIAIVEPIALKNRALRHVFFSDFDNSITSNPVCRYYCIKKIVVINNDYEDKLLERYGLQG